MLPKMKQASKEKEIFLQEIGSVVANSLQHFKVHIFLGKLKFTTFNRNTEGKKQHHTYIAPQACSSEYILYSRG